MIEHQRDLAGGIDAPVIVVIQPRRGDAVSGKDHRRGNVDIVAIAAGEIRVGKVEVAQFEIARLVVGAVFDQPHRLEISGVARGIARGRQQPGMAELRGDPCDCRIIAGVERHSPAQPVRGDEAEIGDQIDLVNPVKRGGNGAGQRGRGGWLGQCRGCGGQQQRGQDQLHAGAHPILRTRPLKSRLPIGTPFIRSRL